MIRSGDHVMEELGRVHVITRRNVRSVTVRWKGGVMSVVCPADMTRDKLLATLREMSPRIEARKPAPLYHIGQKIQLPELEIDIVRLNHAPANMLLTMREDRAYIQVGAEWDMEAPVPLPRDLQRILQWPRGRAHRRAQSPQDSSDKISVLIATKASRNGLFRISQRVRNYRINSVGLGVLGDDMYHKCL